MQDSSSMLQRSLWLPSLPQWSHGTDYSMMWSTVNHSIPSISYLPKPNLIWEFCCLILVESTEYAAQDLWSSWSSPERCETSMSFAEMYSSCFYTWVICFCHSFFAWFLIEIDDIIGPIVGYLFCLRHGAACTSSNLSRSQFFPTVCILIVFVFILSRLHMFVWIVASIWESIFAKYANSTMMM